MSVLTANSGYGKFHLEMHWWHAAHFALWNRTPLLEKSLGWYLSILSSAKHTAETQGYVGARWPKMVGPEGRDSPSPIGPLLIWQQPHPISYAELCYRALGDRKTLELYRPLVFESAASGQPQDVNAEGAGSAEKSYSKTRVLRGLCVELLPFLPIWHCADLAT